MDTDRMPAARAAVELNTTQLKVLMLIKRNSLIGELIDGEWQVTRSSVDHLKAHGCEPTVQVPCRISCNGTSCGDH